MSMLINPYRFAAAGGGGGAYSTEVLADSPLAYWRGDAAPTSTAVDVSGNGRNGTYGQTFNPGAASLLPSDPTGYAMEFRATDAFDRMHLAYAAWMQVPNLTAEALFKLDSASGMRNVVSRWRSGASWIIRTEDTNLVLYVQDTGGLRSATAAGVIAANKTYWVAARVPGGSTAELYYGEVGVHSSPILGASVAVGTLATASGQIEVGANDGVTLLDGYVDEVAFYGTALTSTRLAAHYAAL